MSLFLLQNSISSSTSSWDGNLCFEDFLHLHDKLDILKQSYTVQRKLHKFLNIWGKLLQKFHFASSFSFHSRLVKLFCLSQP